MHIDFARELQDDVDGIFLVDVDDIGTLRAHHVAPGRDPGHHDHATRAHQLRARDRELADRSRAEHGDGIAGSYARELRAEIAGRKDVGHKNRAIVVDFVGLAFASGVRAYCACNPWNGPDIFGPPKNAVPAAAPSGFALSYCAV